jgi:LPXTG-motif cell wall-anchored protein
MVYFDTDELSVFEEQQFSKEMIGDEECWVLTIVQKNDPQVGKINITKKGEKITKGWVYDGQLLPYRQNAPLAEVSFMIYAAENIYAPDGSGTLLFASGAAVLKNPLVTDSNGHAATGALPLGKYVLKETQGASGFTSDYEEEFELTPMNPEQAIDIRHMTAVNEAQRLNLEVIKEEDGSGYRLPRTKFGVYTASDLTLGTPPAEPQGILEHIAAFVEELTSGWIYTVDADTLVRTGWTDETGKVLFEDLPPGRYYVKELVAPDGYELDQGWRSDVMLVYNGNEPVIKMPVTCTDRPFGYAEVYKVGDKFDRATRLGTTNPSFTVTESALAGATFGIYTPSVYGSQNYDTLVETIITDDEGYARSGNLYVGRYMLREISAPIGNLAAQDRFFEIKAQNGQQEKNIFIYEIGDERKKLDVRVIKKEEGSETPLSSAEISIYAENDIVMKRMTIPEDTLIQKGVTDADGIVNFTDLPQGTYYLKETKAPEGYKINENWRPTVFLYYSDGDEEHILFEKTCINKVFGYAEVYKAVEVFNGVTGITKGNTVFGKRAAQLSGAVFSVYKWDDGEQNPAATDAQGRSYVFVEDIVTDDDGYARTSDLDIGEYLLRESTAPDGNLLTEDRVFSIVPREGDQEKNIFTYKIEDEKQTLNLNVVKQEEFSGTLLSGARIGLYAAEDIPLGEPTPIELPSKGIEDLIDDINQSIKDLIDAINGNSKEPPEAAVYEIPKDTLIMDADTDEQGKTRFTDLPPGTYYLKETKAPKGYRINENWKPTVTLSYDGNTEPTLSWAETCVDEVFGYAELYKTGEVFSELTGGGMEDSVFDVTVAGIEGAVFEVFKLKKGTTVGEPPLPGVADDTETEEDDADTDEPDAASEEDEDSDAIVWIDGQRYVYESVEEITTDEDGYARTSDLPIGNYMLSEKKAPTGYLPTGDRFFEIEPQFGHQEKNVFTYEIEEFRRKLNLEVLKTEDGTHIPLAGTKFGLYAAKEDVDTIDSGIKKATDAAFVVGELSTLVPGETLIRTAVTGEDGKATFADLPQGKYTVKELAPPEGYARGKVYSQDITISYDKGYKYKETLTFKMKFANKKIFVGSEIEKRAKEKLAVNETAFEYELDFWSTSNVRAEEFVVDDPLEAVSKNLIRIKGLWTAVTYGDTDGKMNVWYKTNKTYDGVDYSDVTATATNPTNPRNPDKAVVYPNTGFRLWARNVKASVNTYLSVESLNLTEGEYVTAIRFEFGAVDIGFTTKDAKAGAPAKILAEVYQAKPGDTIPNSASTHIARDGEPGTADKDEVITRMPAVAEAEKAKLPKTGDGTNLGFWIGLLAVAAGGAIALVIIRRQNRR